MELKHPEIEIPKENPFAHDMLEREKCSKTLTALVENLPGPFVLSINGGWGTGKTTFLKMWKQQLKNEGFTEIYFSAWEDDYCDDPLVALIGQLWKNLKDSDFEEIRRTLKECAVPFVRKTVFNTIKTTTVGVIDLDEKELKSIAEKTVNEYIRVGNDIKDVKRRLEKLAQKVKTKTEGKPLVIIIDELDRCRPLFAIELLEKIKHLFDIPGIVFVLGIDREQLGYSVKSIYGQDMNTDGYLRRFIDMEFILSAGNSEIFTTYLVSRFELGSILDNLPEFAQIHPVLVDLFSLSLRDQEQCFRILVTAASSVGRKGVLTDSYLLSCLSVLKIANPSAYLIVSKGQYNSPADIINILLEIKSGKDVLNSWIGRRLEAYLIAIAYKDDWKLRVQSESDRSLIIKQAVFNRLIEYSKDQAEDLFEIVNKLMEHYRGCLPNLVSKLSEHIELASLMVRRDI